MRMRGVYQLHTQRASRITSPVQSELLTSEIDELEENTYHPSPSPLLETTNKEVDKKQFFKTTTGPFARNYSVLEPTQSEPSESPFTNDDGVGSVGFMTGHNWTKLNPRFPIIEKIKVVGN